MSRTIKTKLIHSTGLEATGADKMKELMDPVEAQSEKDLKNSN